MDIFCNCDRCNLPILEGEEFFTITKEFNKAVFNKKRKDFEIEIEESESLFIFCLDCTNKIDFQILISGKGNFTAKPNEN